MPLIGCRPVLMVYNIVSFTDAKVVMIFETTK